jgi:glycosyltransferase involved in cell wall biosynthesis
MRSGLSEIPLQVLDAQRERYLRNSLLNLTRLETAGDVASLADACRGVPAIIAAAGPSLNRNLEELIAVRAASGDGALLLSVDMALATCLAAGLEPHFAIAAAPGGGLSHLRELPPCPSTCMVAEPGSDPAAFEEFDGRTLVFRASDHDLQPWPWLRAQGIERGTLRNGGASVIAAIDFARLLGCDPIVLIGADFAYTGGQPCCRGTAYERAWSDAVARGQSLHDIWQAWLTAPGCDMETLRGERMRTTAALIALSQAVLELSIEDSRRRYINATGDGILKGGAFAIEPLTSAVPGGASPRHPAHTIASASSQPPTDGRPRRAPFEWTLAHEADSIERWRTLWDVAPETDLAGMIGDAIERVHRDRLKTGGGTAPAASNDLRERLTAATAPDAAITGELVARLSDGSWRQWALADRVQLIHDVTRLYRSTWSTLASDVFPALAEVFRSTLTPELHAGIGVSLYDELCLLRWMTSDDASKVTSFRDEVLAPFARHVRQWAPELQLEPRRQPGAPPYRVAYLVHSRELVVNEAVTPLIFSMLRGHAALASDRFRIFYYASNGLVDGYRREIEALGVTVREIEAGKAPCAGLARLRAHLEEDRIDVLLTVDPAGLPTVLFETRSAPIQVLLDMGFSAWLTGESLDYTMLSFAGDPRLLDLSPAMHERIDYHFDARFVSPAVDPAEVAAQRARFGSARHVYGFVGRLVKLSPDYFRALRAILERVPDAAAYLGGLGDDTAIREALSAFGPAADRVVVDPRVVDGPVLMHAIDTFLDSFPFIGGLSCLQAQAARRPVVYLADQRPGYARFLALARDSMLKASSVDEYAALASQLGLDPVHYAARAGEAERIAIRMTHVSSVAARLEDALDRLIQRTRT